MSSLIAFAMAAAYVYLGYALGAYLARRGTARGAAQPTVIPSAAETKPAAPAFSHQQADSLLARIHQVTADVDKDVDRHASRVAEISGDLRFEEAPGADQSAVVMAAAGKLLEANRVLQHDLASAHAEIETQQTQLKSYMAQAMTDALTGLANRRRFNEELDRRIDQWRRQRTPLSLILIDIDHFKAFNDAHGHPAGDAVLSQVSNVLADGIRTMDLAARYGGEEFGLILPGAALDDAQKVAQRVRDAVARGRYTYGGKQHSVTVSAGVAQARDGETAETLVQRADAALLAAKQAGRNACHANTGDECVAVHDMAALRPSALERTQRIAPFSDGHFPEPGMFRSLECEDLSATAFTYLAHERPDYDKVLVALGEPAGRAYASASVQGVWSIGDGDDSVYRVSCRFTSPVDRFTQPAEA